MLFFGIAQKNLETMNRPKLSKKRPALKNKARQQTLDEKRAIFKVAYEDYKKGNISRSLAIDKAIKGTKYTRQIFQSAWHYYAGHWL